MFYYVCSQTLRVCNSTIRTHWNEFISKWKFHISDRNNIHFSMYSFECTERLSNFYLHICDKDLRHSSIVYWGYQDNFKPVYYFFLTKKLRAHKNTSHFEVYARVKNCCICCLVLAYFCFPSWFCLWRVFVRAKSSPQNK